METTVEERQERKLLIADRCDRCGAQAFVLVKGVAGELYFCGHHYAKNEKALIKFSYEIIDERDFINEKSSSSPI
jgi:dTDP-D-glucose 4,6-dehydratase